MRLGALVASVMVVGGLGLATYAFIDSASPYVTVKEAQTTRGDSLHLAGTLIKESIAVDRSSGLVRFQIKDEAGDLADIVYTGLPPKNLGDATKVVAIGAMKAGSFHSRRLLLKCPSKYESAT